MCKALLKFSMNHCPGVHHMPARCMALEQISFHLCAVYSASQVQGSVLGTGDTPVNKAGVKLTHKKQANH